MGKGIYFDESSVEHTAGCYTNVDSPEICCDMCMKGNKNTQFSKYNPTDRKCYCRKSKDGVVIRTEAGSDSDTVNYCGCHSEISLIVNKNPCSF